MSRCPDVGEDKTSEMTGCQSYQNVGVVKTSEMSKSGDVKLSEMTGWQNVRGDLVEWAIATHGMYESRLCFNIFTTTHVPLLP